MRLESLRTILALTVIRDLDTTQFYILSLPPRHDQGGEQPEGFVAPGKKGWVWHLKKGLYG